MGLDDLVKDGLCDKHQERVLSQARHLGGLTCQIEMPMKDDVFVFLYPCACLLFLLVGCSVANA